MSFGQSGDADGGMASASNMAWGADDKGQLGDGKTITAVAGSIGTGYALGSDGTTPAFGSDTVGQLGNGTTTSAPGRGVVTVTGPKAAALGAGGSTGYLVASH